MPKESERKGSEKTISDRLGINDKSDSAALNDLTSNDGNEDPGAELDLEFAYNSSKEKNTDDKKIDKGSTTSETPNTLPEQLDALTNNDPKKKEKTPTKEKTHPQPQADEVLNPELNSQNDI